MDRASRTGEAASEVDEMGQSRRLIKTMLFLAIVAALGSVYMGAALSVAA